MPIFDSERRVYRTPKNIVGPVYGSFMPIFQNSILLSTVKNVVGPVYQLLKCVYPMAGKNPYFMSRIVHRAQTVLVVAKHILLIQCLCS